MTTHRIDGLVIHTNHVYPPIPLRQFDWSAVTDDYDGAPDAGPQLTGSGPTEWAAIHDLLQEARWRTDDRLHELGIAWPGMLEPSSEWG